MMWTVTVPLPANPDGMNAAVTYVPNVFVWKLDTFHGSVWYGVVIVMVMPLGRGPSLVADTEKRYLLAPLRYRFWLTPA